jgi:hypothetical protein
MHRLLFPVLALSLQACVVHDNNPPPPGNVPPRADSAGEPTLSLGPQQYPGYRVLAGASSAIPGGDLGYIVTANGSGGFRITWTDTLGSAAGFSGTITTDGTFDQTQTRGFSGAESLSYLAANQLAFSSTPGANVDGVDVVASTDPIYLDAAIDGSDAGVHIYFTGAQTGLVVASGYDPVAFTSP